MTAQQSGMGRAAAPARDSYRAFRSITTRWMDNDAYGHVNNFDTAVNGYLIDTAKTDIRALPAIGLVVETSCRYFEPVSFPEPLEAGIAVQRLGRTSIAYQVGIFRAGAASAAAAGSFVHVYVDSATRKPVEIPAVIRQAVQGL
jgi:acyl-CoA thioester hydrolase